MTATVLAPADISTSATDYQADGTAAPGTTGRIADAGHVHPSSTTLNWEYVTLQVYPTVPVTGGDWTIPSGPYTVSAPTGYKVVSGGYNGSQYIPSGAYSTGGALYGVTSAPASDGSSWTVTAPNLQSQVGNFGSGGNNTAYTVITVWAICIQVA